MIREFVESRYGSGSGRMSIWWRKDYGKTAYNSSEWYSYPADLDKIVAKIESLKSKDVCITTSLYDADNRTPEHATVTSSVWMDSDTFDGSTYRLAPTWTVRSSAGRWQHHWDLIEPVETSLASEASHRMAIAHAAEGADPSSWAPNKIMRSVGTSNTGHGFSENVTGTTTGELFDIYDILGAYDDISVVERPKMEVHYDALVSPDDLPDYEATLDKLPRKVIDTALAEPKDGQDRSKLRYRLLCDLFREGLSFDEVLSIAWHAPASRKWSREDTRGIAGLQAEATKAQVETENEVPDFKSFDVAEIEENIPESIVDMLTPAEREEIADHSTFIDRYVTYTGSLVAKQNKPYDRMNAWTILSAAFCTVGTIPYSSGSASLNMWSLTFGDTTTGKSQAYKTKIRFLEEIFGPEDGFDIGGNPSTTALQDKLIERDGKVSWFNRDEAYGALEAWQKNDWQSGILADLALLYDGRVPAALIKANKENSGKTAKTYFLMDLIGATKLTMDSLGLGMFHSGFLARFVFVRGEPREISDELVLDKFSDGTEVKMGFDYSARQFAAEFADTKRDLRSGNQSDELALKIPHDVNTRLARVRKYFRDTFSTHRHWDILDPTMERTAVTILKCASLLALSDGRVEVNMHDLLYAIRQAEEWITNLLFVASRISGSEFQRQADEVEEFIREQGGEVKRSVVMTYFRKYELKTMLPLVESLLQQNRVREFNGTGGQEYLTTRGKN